MTYLQLCTKSYKWPLYLQGVHQSIIVEDCGYTVCLFIHLVEEVEGGQGRSWGHGYFRVLVFLEKDRSSNLKKSEGYSVR